LYLSSICATKPFACDKETGHEYTIRTLVEQHNIAEAYTLKT
ncbi:LysR family transcriptional regulator, partial [Acinetobacter baumannii]|nr:LysR family transcriptional regulator [Acinetobacter baumannii]